MVHTGENYQPWQIVSEAFQACTGLHDQMKFLLRYAVLAPSTHNSQPWRFALRDQSIVAFTDQRRHLPVSDGDGRLRMISMGCALENLLVAADYYGLQTSVQYAGETTDLPQGAVFRVTCDLSPLQNSQRSFEDHLISSVSKRQTHREPYRSDHPDLSFLDTIFDELPETFRIDVISERERREQVAHLILESRFEWFKDSAFRAELADYKKTNFTRSAVGIPGHCMGFGNAFSLIAPTLIRYVDVMKFLQEPERELLIEHTPVYVLLSSRAQTLQQWIQAGQWYERIALEAERKGVQSAITAVPTDLKPLQDHLGTDFYPQVFLRLGYRATAQPSPHSPRMSVDDVLIS